MEPLVNNPAGQPLSTRVKVIAWLLLLFLLAILGVSVASLVESVDIRKKVKELSNGNVPIGPTPHPSYEPSPSPSGAASPEPEPAAAIPKSASFADPAPTEFPLPLPPAYVVPDVYILPPTDQDGLGTCWAFGTIYLFESQYHAQGVERGFLIDNATHSEYVQLSVQAYFSVMRENCLSNWTAACNYGGVLAGNSSEDQEIESVYYFDKAWPKFGQQILPDAVCPYKTYDGQPDFNYFDCPGLDEALADGQNPISWKIKSMTMAYETEKIKQLLLTKKRALGIGTPLSYMIYYIPCEGSAFNASDDCVNKQYPCPDGDGYCAKLEVDGRNRDGVFQAETDPKYMGELGGHAMDIMGYNDEWVFHERFQSANGGDLPVPLKGAFILHNSWTADMGHSVQYLLGNQSQENEDYLCPNRDNPDNWIPVSKECLESQAGMDSLIATYSDPNGPKINCSEVGETTIRRIRGKRGVWGWPDVLKCSRYSSLCDHGDDLFYFLAKASPQDSDADVKYLYSGLHEVSLLRVNISSREVTSVKLSKLPFWVLPSAFFPIDVDSPSTANDPDNCGFWVFPYETLENMKRLNWDLLDNFRVVDLEIEFANQSYLLGGAEAFNATLLKASTKFIKKPQFDGPLPYDKIYTTPIAEPRPWRKHRSYL